MKKFVTLALSFLFIFTLVGCTKKEEAKKEEATDTRNQSYYNTYTGLYDTNIANLTSYDIKMHIQQKKHIKVLNIQEIKSI